MPKFSDLAKEEYDRKKGEKNAKEELANQFNNAALKGISSFINNIESGSVEISSVAEAGRLFQIYLELNGIKEGMETGEGSLPALTEMQRDLFQDSVESLGTNEEGEEESYVREEDFTQLTPEQIAEKLNKREQLLNEDNEKTGEA